MDRDTGTTIIPIILASATILLILAMQHNAHGFGHFVL